jgi:hypothetical protein
VEEMEGDLRMLRENTPQRLKPALVPESLWHD